MYTYDDNLPAVKFNPAVDFDSYATFRGAIMSDRIPVKAVITSTNYSSAGPDGTIVYSATLDSNGNPIRLGIDETYPSGGHEINVYLYTYSCP